MFWPLMFLKIVFGQPQFFYPKIMCKCLQLLGWGLEKRWIEIVCPVSPHIFGPLLRVNKYLSKYSYWFLSSSFLSGFLLGLLVGRPKVDNSNYNPAVIQNCNYELFRCKELKDLIQKLNKCWNCSHNIKKASKVVSQLVNELQYWQTVLNGEI